MVAFQGYHDCAPIYGRTSCSAAALGVGQALLQCIASCRIVARISYSAAALGVGQALL